VEPHMYANLTMIFWVWFGNATR